MSAKKITALAFAGVLTLFPLSSLSGCSSSEETVRLKIFNCEEYIDDGGEGSYGYDVLEIEEAPSLIDDFESWYKKTYGKTVIVEYSCYGTNEDLYNQLLLGDQYDLLCPSDYMIMKLAAENRLQTFPESFFDETDENNYYVNYVSDYIKDIFDGNYVTVAQTGETNTWSKYAAGYMWGTTGLVYNPDSVDEGDLEKDGWGILLNADYRNRVTTKDNVRDSYFVGLAIYYREQLLALKEQNSAGTLSDDDYNAKVTEYMNDTSKETAAAVQEILLDMKENIYGFETDTGKNDLVTGKISINFAWSGDAVYAIDLAEEKDVYLSYYIPEEASNLWFDGWVIPKSSEHSEEAAAFVNYLSMPENAIRNMYYIGYTSVIAGDEVLEYMKDTYGADPEEDEETAEYDLSYFFGDGHTITTSEDQLSRQLFAQYPTEDIMMRLAVMDYFDEETYDVINEMWTKVKGATLDAWAIAVIVVGVVAIVAFVVYVKLGSKIDWFRSKPKKGYKKVKEEPCRTVVDLRQP